VEPADAIPDANERGRFDQLRSNGFAAAPDKALGKGNR
jgi:hypothetical protein